MQPPTERCHNSAHPKPTTPMSAPVSGAATISAVEFFISGINPAAGAAIRAMDSTVPMAGMTATTVTTTMPRMSSSARTH